MKLKEKDYLMPLETAGLKFRNNFVVGSGPAVKTLDMVKAIERWGWGAASLKLTRLMAPATRVLPEGAKARLVTSPVTPVKV